MKLKNNEIKYLAQSFAPQSPLSVFGNIETELDGKEYQGLVDKGVIVNNSYSSEALEILTLLTKPERSARFIAQTPNYVVEKYTYKIGGKTLLAENNEGELEFTDIPDITTLSSKFTEIFGLSAFSTTDLDEVFDPTEMVVFFALADLTRKECLAKYADIKADEAGYDESAVIAESKGEYKNGLTGMFLKNYRLDPPAADRVKTALVSLAERKIVSTGGKYSLIGEYKKFAENFLVLDTIAFYEAFSTLPSGDIASMEKLTASAGKNDILAIFYDGEAVQFNTISAIQLLYNIEAVMSCPEFEPPVEEPVPVPEPAPAPAPVTPPPPVAPPAPAPAAAPSAPAAPASWTCASCGRVNTGNFCAGCGSKRP